MNSDIIKIGTRGSKLALWQAHHVAEILQKQGRSTHIEIIETQGDKILNKSISKIGSKGVFTQELEEQLINGSIDIAVHSAKDLQSELVNPLEIIAYTTREMVNDVLVSLKKDTSLKTKGLVIGTSSTRRVAILKHFYPEIKTVDMRGNLQTRFKKMEEGLCQAMILAYAGVHRMEYDKNIVEMLPTDVFIPPVGQGSIAIEASRDLYPRKREMIRKAVNDERTEACLIAERMFLKTLQGGCSIPVFGFAELDHNQIRMTGGIISLDGKKIIKFKETGDASISQTIGKNLARKVLEAGGDVILQEIKSKLNANE